MVDMNLEVSDNNLQYIELIEEAQDIRDGQPFPEEYLEPRRRVWEDPSMQKCWERGNEAAFPDKYLYVPIEQDIVHTRARTIGITETVFNLRENEMLMVDVGGQKSERRKWIHCFQDVTSILFLVSLSRYDQCLIEDKDANQMQDTMTIWDSICHSQWFKQTSIILFLNKDDLFQKKIPHSDIKNFFPDFDGKANDICTGCDYFRKHFARLVQKANQKEREIYIHITTATDTAML
ncbi:guanine nucleotide binding protein, alpha subunit [Cytidiella melzeri]|nr:guanine nucleotide binding protein, alpha subunit [Cytidiella melzeri]